MAQSINVDMTPGLFMPTLHYSQGDVGREFVINLATRDGMTIPAGATVTMQATKPSGFGFSVTGTLSGTVATFTTTDTMTDEYGRFQAEIVIAQGTTVIGTTNFWLEGEKNPHPEGTIDGSQGTIIPELTLLVERVETAASSILDMDVVATTLAAGSQATYSYDEDTNTATFGIPQGEAGAGSAGVVASAYSSSSTYAVGDYVIHNSNLYRCTTAITTAESFTAAHWTQVVLADDVSDLSSDLNDIVDDTMNTAVSQVDTDVTITFTAGFLNLNGTIDSSSAYQYSNKVSVKPNDKIEYYKSGTRTNIRAIVAYVGGVADASKGISSSGGINTYYVPSGVSELAFDFTNANVGGEIRITRDSYTYIQKFDSRLAQFFSESDATLYQTANSYRLLKNGFCEANENYKMLKYSVPANTFVHVKSVDVFQFQNGYSVPTSGTNPRLGGVTYESGEYYLITPSSTNYVIVSVPTSDSDKHCFKMNAVIANENDSWEA